MRGLMLNLLLITIIWGTLLMVLVVIGYIILPLTSSPNASSLQSLIRTSVSVALFVVWLLWWITLTYFWTYNVLTPKRSREVEKRE